MSEKDDFSKNVKLIHRHLAMFFAFVGVVATTLVYMAIDPTFSSFKSEKASNLAVAEEVDEDLIVDGIHVRTGLIDDEGLMVVVNNCTNCHAAKLVTQNRMNKERWEATIDWMQETQNLWDLGGNEEIIINYLVKNYPPLVMGRRPILANVEWYDLKQ